MSVQPSITHWSCRWLLVGVLAVMLAAMPALVSGQVVEYQAQLSGAEEVPAVTTAATGTFMAAFDPVTGAVHWTLSVPAITEATAAHIHLGARGVNGPIVVDLLGMPEAPLASIDISGTATVANLVGPLEGDGVGFLAALQAEELYVNVHTTTHPAGEIRGQITPVVAAPPPPAPAPPPAPLGSLGPVSEAGNGGIAALMFTLTVALIAGGRALSARRVRVR